MKRPAMFSTNLFVLALATALASGCSALTPTVGEHGSRYSLDGMPVATAAAPASGPTLVVSPPHAAAGSHA